MCYYNVLLLRILVAVQAEDNLVGAFRARRIIRDGEGGVGGGDGATAFVDIVQPVGMASIASSLRILTYLTAFPTYTYILYRLAHLLTYVLPFSLTHSLKVGMDGVNRVFPNLISR